jgi:hypothetical protein
MEDEQGQQQILADYRENRVLSRDLTVAWSSGVQAVSRSYTPRWRAIVWHGETERP